MVRSSCCNRMMIFVGKLHLTTFRCFRCYFHGSLPSLHCKMYPTSTLTLLRTRLLWRWYCLFNIIGDFLPLINDVCQVFGFLWGLGSVTFGLGQSMPVTKPSLYLLLAGCLSPRCQSSWQCVGVCHHSRLDLSYWSSLAFSGAASR
jgi:hypothetical protein